MEGNEEGREGRVTPPPTEPPEVETINLDLTSPEPGMVKAKPILGSVKVTHFERRERAAQMVAYTLVATFAGSIALGLIISWAIGITIAIRCGSLELAKASTDAATTLFESLGKFVSPVFGPLLAFVLGYYFSKEQREQPSPKTPEDRA